MSSFDNRVPQSAPGTSFSGVDHGSENSIPLSIFPVGIKDKFCFAFCGLPARGKTHIASRLARYLEFFHSIPVQVFNVAEFRRLQHGNVSEAEWFDNNNAEGMAVRDACNKKAVNAMVNWLYNNDGGVAILDSTNSTHARRSEVAEAVRGTGAKIMFIEVSTTMNSQIDRFITEVATSSPDYQGMDNKLAESDYRNRLEKYAIFYEVLDDGNHPEESRWSYFKCDHGEHKFTCHRVRGHLPLKVVHFIMNLRNSSHSFFLTRHGQSEYNAIGRIGGDSGISEYGIEYAKKLSEFVDKRVTHAPDRTPLPARLWTSTMRRTIETAQFIKHSSITVKDEDNDDLEFEWLQMRPRRWHHLDELFAGSCDGMTYDEIKEKFPNEYNMRQKDKLAYRYPRGESYLDVIARLEPVILEMERHREPLLIIGHQAVLRIVYAFYTGLSRTEAPYVSIPLNTVVEMVPSAFGCKVDRHLLYSPPEPLSNDGQDEPMVGGREAERQAHRRNVDPPSH